MKKIAFLVLFVISRIGSPAMGSAGTLYTAPARVGLVLVGATADGFVLAVDGSSLNADGRISQEQKLFPVGRRAAVAIFGAVSVQDPVGAQVRGELNVSRIVDAWLKAHPETDLAAADHGLNSEIAGAANQFFSTRDPGAARGAFKFGVVLAGFADGKRVVNTTRYFMPAAKGRPVRVERTSTPVRDSDVWVFGNSAGVREMLSRAVQKRESGYAMLFRDAINLAETPENRRRDGRKAVVAPPNRLAIITPNDGFLWRQE
ncbi:MAG TPA: hypothetical protein VFR84_02330 [Candidatus Angelobacter sp.]|nr:hypothetical protein [Candidatus Angelobacter sp.]